MPVDTRDYLRRFQDRIARHHYLNWTTSVHTRVDIDVSAADAYLVASGLDRNDPPVTREHLWLCAAARVLRARPLFNVAYDGLRRLEPREPIHLRVSLALDGRQCWGVIEHANRLDPIQMARAHAGLRAGALDPERVAAAPVHRSGRIGRLIDDLIATAVDLAPHLEQRLGYDPGHEAGTFSVLNAGALGAEDLHAVLLRPAVAMLVVLAPKQVVEPGPDGPRVCWRVPMAAPFCHKLMDTDAAGYFLHHMQALLDDPAGLAEPAARGAGGAP